jgi:uncharacterized repeat protein (TIGR03806 family)
VVITNAPGTERLFVAEQGGKVYSFANEPESRQRDLVVDLKTARPELTAVYGLTFHPSFQRNHFVYVCYVTGDNVPDGSRVSRFGVSGSPPRIDPQTEQVIITWLSGGHNGGCLKFGPDGYLYISTGDGGPASPPDPLRAGQDVSNLLSAILRIDVDQADAGKAYRVPPDNPLLGVDGARPEIWAYGFRNPWKMSFDRVTGDLWVGDVGWELWEMIYRVRKGGNYGWSVMEGRQVVHPGEKRGPTPILAPTIDHPHSEAASITGGFVYRGTRIKPLVGAYIYGDFQTGIVWGARWEGDSLTWHQELARTPLQLVDFGEDQAGELYLLDYRGQLYQLAENSLQDASRNFPRRLSETGLFAAVAAEEPAPGVVPYWINAEQWADHTQARRWLAVPGSQPITIDGRGSWQFPDGSVLVKTVSIETEPGVASSRQRLETQVLHREDGSWRPYTYAWNEEQTDAALVGDSGVDRRLQMRDSDREDLGGWREQTYHIASGKECFLCHNPWVESKTTVFGFQSASPLAVHAIQLNRQVDYGQGSTHQLRMLHKMGLLDARLAEPPESAGRLVDPYDASADLNNRARAYLHVNCAHCHQFNAGGAATIALAHDVPLAETRAIDMRPTQGTFGISDARIIAAGDADGSVLVYRLAKLGAGRMPRLGSEEVDMQGVRLLREWISQLGPYQHQHATEGRPGDQRAQMAKDLEELVGPTSGQGTAAAIQRLTSSTRGALALSRLIDEGDLTEVRRRQIIDAAKDHPLAEVRDLFQRFVPAAQRTRRLGTAIDPAQLLSLPSNVERGRQVFFSDSTAACKNCHRIHAAGDALGPDLSQIGKKYDRQQLLEQILEPAKFIEPAYVPYLLEEADGRVLVGLIVDDTDQEVVLRDAANVLHRVPKKEVELLVRQQKSLMPDLLLRDMTPQQVADLLAYLASLQ